MSALPFFMNSGIYSLTIKLDKDITIRIGELGKCVFPKGFYIYTGSGKRNLSQRVERHKRRDNKKLRWHIDYFLNSKSTHIEDIFILKDSKLSECSLNKRVLSKKGAEIVIKGFGSSDCKAGCGSHLVYFDKNIMINDLLDDQA